VGREVFHVPSRSHFVFVSLIKALRGSDASNVHDEEPGDDELEFSDDEAEAAHRSRLKKMSVFPNSLSLLLLMISPRRGESRARSAASSRSSTPNPTLMRDQELADETFFSRNAYDEHGPYDMDFPVAGPSSSRPAPIPYDDPYGEAYTAPDVEVREARLEADLSSRRPSDRGSAAHPGSSYDRTLRPERGRGRGSRGRGHGGNSQGDRGRGGRGRERGPQKFGKDRSFSSSDPYGNRPTQPRSMSPTSLAIARATGQISYSGQDQQQQHYQNAPQDHRSPMYSDANAGSWSYGEVPMPYGYIPQGYPPQHQGQNFMQTAPFVQPHINPRFASAFGLGLQAQGQQGYNPMSPMGHQQQEFTYPGQNSMAIGGEAAPSTHAASSNWADEWTVPVQERFSSGATEEPKNS